MLRGGDLLGAAGLVQAGGCGEPASAQVPGQLPDQGPIFLADSKGLSNPAEVEALREKVYASLEAYCKHKYPEQPGR